MIFVYFRSLLSSDHPLIVSPIWGWWGLEQNAYRCRRLYYNIIWIFLKLEMKYINYIFNLITWHDVHVNNNLFKYRISQRECCNPLITYYFIFKTLEISRIIKIFKKILNKFLMSFLDNSREEPQLIDLILVELRSSSCTNRRAW